MARSLSATFIGAMNAQQTGEIPLYILEIVHADITTLRFVNNSADVVSNGETYIAWPFQVAIPPVDAEDQVPKVQLSIDNVDQSIVETVRSITSPPTIRIAIILLSDPDTIEAGWYELSLKDVTYDVMTVSGELGYEDIQDEPYPADTFNPQEWPGLF